MQKPPVPTCSETVTLACLLEATAPKPGNVHPDAVFADVCYTDFVQSAFAIGPSIAESAQIGVGASILHAVDATQQGVGSNTNLGMILLLAPLAAVPAGRTLSAGIADVLRQLTITDAGQTYAAIRLAHPGGLGTASDQDIATAPTETLLQVMTRAADRDSVAAQYATNFDLVLNFALPMLTEHWNDGWTWQSAVVRTHLELMAHTPDTLIARKCGWKTAEESARRARQVLTRSSREHGNQADAIREFDHWLRADGHRRNPGTTADLIAAALFAGLRDGILTAPCCPLHSSRL